MNSTQKQDAGLVIGRYVGVYQQVQGRMYAVKLQIGEGQGVKGRQDRLGVLGHWG